MTRYGIWLTICPFDRQAGWTVVTRRTSLFKIRRHHDARYYCSLGELIRVLGQERQVKGTYRKIWDGKDNKGHRMAEGSYYYQVISGDFISSKAMIKIK
jgi:flagellar hook assembly protein FlgD